MSMLAALLSSVLGQIVAMHQSKNPPALNMLEWHSPGTPVENPAASTHPRFHVPERYLLYSEKRGILGSKGGPCALSRPTYR